MISKKKKHQQLRSALLYALYAHAAAAVIATLFIIGFGLISEIITNGISGVHECYVDLGSFRKSSCSFSEFSFDQIFYSIILFFAMLSSILNPSTTLIIVITMLLILSYFNKVKKPNKKLILLVSPFLYIILMLASNGVTRLVSLIL